MKYSVEYNQDLNSLLGRFEGDLEPQSLGEYVAEIARLARKHPCYRFLNDCRYANIQMSIIDIYETPGLIIKEEFDHRWKRALMVKKSDLENAQFYEDAANNRSIRVKIFTDKDKAIEWLNS